MRRDLYKCSTCGDPLPDFATAAVHACIARPLPSELEVTERLADALADGTLAHPWSPPPTPMVCDSCAQIVEGDDHECPQCPVAGCVDHLPHVHPRDIFAAERYAHRSASTLDSRETITAEAERLVLGDRQDDYGHPADDFARTGRIWAAILGLDQVTPEQVALCMVGVKISREVNSPKRDNRVDGIGYFLTDQLIHERAEQ